MCVTIIKDGEVISCIQSGGRHRESWRGVGRGGNGEKRVWCRNSKKKGFNLTNETELIPDTVN